MKRRTPILALFVVMLVLGVSVGSAWSYFTDTTYAEGGLDLSLQTSTSLEEENEAGYKYITIRNTSSVVEVWVRAYVFANDDLGVTVSGENWKHNDETNWYEYTQTLPVMPEEKRETKKLMVHFELTSPNDLDKVVHDGDEADVIVVYESLPVTYDADGKPVAAKWN